MSRDACISSGYFCDYSQFQVGRNLALILEIRVRGQGYSFRFKPFLLRVWSKLTFSVEDPDSKSLLEVVRLLFQVHLQARFVLNPTEPQF